MVHWIWIIVVAMLAGSFGALIMAVFIGANRRRWEDDGQ
jgi:hypothetical protein